jgi:hypothetical protein
MLDQLEELLADLPPIRWPDPPDLDAELAFALGCVSPRTARLAEAVVRELAATAGDLSGFLRALDVVAIHAGGHREAELAGVLLTVSDRIREWRETDA